IMPQEMLAKAMSLMFEIAPCVKDCDVNEKDKDGFALTTTVENVQAVLETVKSSDYSCCVIDYFQLIQTSKGGPRKTYSILNELRIWLGQYITDSNVPIVLLAQLHSIGKRPNKDL